jgi:hypothetical protein
MALLTAVTFGVAGCSHVTEDWKAAQAADTTEAYQDFLRQHPDSEFSAPAQERVKQLAEDRDWQQASKTDTLDAYQQFVATHADGKWAQEARVRIENFQLTASGQAPPATPGAEGSVNAAVPPAGSGAPAGVGAPAAPALKPAPAAKPAAAAATKPPPAKSSKPKVVTKSVAAKPAGKHLAQLGAYGSKASAQSAWHKLKSRFPGQLQSLQPHYVVVTRLHAKPLVRLQVAVSSSERAHELCAALKKQSQACVPVG